jgi:hypothetical protein
MTILPRQWAILYSGSDADIYYALKKGLAAHKIKFHSKYFDAHEHTKKRRGVFPLDYDMFRDETYTNPQFAREVESANSYIIEVKTRDYHDAEKYLKSITAKDGK